MTRKISRKVVLLCLLLSVIYVNGQSWNELNKLVSEDRRSTDQFAYSVAIEKDYAVVGAYGQDYDENNTNTVLESGAVYVFKKNSSGNWAQHQKLVAPDRSYNDWMGWAVSIDGDFIAVGAPREDLDSSMGVFLNPGSVYIYRKDLQGNFSFVQKLQAADATDNANFGYTVDLSGTNLIVGAPLDDLDKDSDNDSSDAGSAYIFSYTGAQWKQVKKISASDRRAGDRFGLSVSISGSKAIVGSPWQALDENGINFLEKSGAAYLFSLDGPEWKEMQKVCAADRGTNAQFGFDVAIDNSFAIVGAVGDSKDTLGADSLSFAGSAYLFEESALWHQTQKLLAADRAENDWFGFAVDISGSFAIVGAYQKQGNFSLFAGAAYVYERNGAGNWLQYQKISASDQEKDDWFGFSVAIWQYQCLIGALKEDHDADGANPIGQAGSAYIFTLDSKLSFAINETAVLHVYPNPNSGSFTLSGLANFTGLVVVVRDLNGKELQQVTGTEVTSMDLNLNLVPGVYLLECRKGAEIIYLRMLIR